MASIFKRSKKKGSPYWFQWYDHLGKRRTSKGFTDRGLTEQAAAKKEEEARLRRLGLIDPEQEKIAGQRRTALTEHLEAFEKSLKKNSEKHWKLTMSRVRRIVKDCNFETLFDISKLAVECSLTEMLDDEEIGHKTYNHYAQAIESFCYWCVENDRLLASPLRGLERLNTAVDVRHKRRALNAGDLERLVQSARDSGEDIQCFSGEHRARLYILSYMTGLRRKEIASLKPRSFDLNAYPPTVTVEAACSKHRRLDVLPMHPELVTLVRSWIAELKPSDVLFPKLAKRRTWLMVKKDLERVGIPYENEDGIADFHAAGRHSHITGLVRSGASLPEAQKLARHTDIKMTMKYTHIGMEDQAKAVGNLPALQMRCSSAVPGSLSESPPVTKTQSENETTPVIDEGCVVSSHPVAQGDMMEAAGIE
ncbi:tyrosine-type recombinase/integrase [Anatilimnocola floriformis]|uniref:tyrosine-type recombinase/integrase n=1 Tax=Anatilimnocola floriformis TaxID=2948575 RepID=UPI0020C2F2EF|nr:tyrosine-type recombinase/integrase [Anatilimnocola floriformis]